MEIWKDINGFEGIYQISNLGRLKSLARTADFVNGAIIQRKERILVAGVIGRERNYLGVALSKNKKQKTYPVHRLVANAFIPNPENKPQVNHIDSNPSNNHVDNLEWVTERENQSHRYSKEKTSSKFTGVCYHKRKNNWVAYVDFNGKRKHLGYFNTEQGASNAYYDFLHKHLISNKYGK